MYNAIFAGFNCLIPDHEMFITLFLAFQLNSYERDGLIISDMLTYENSDIYEVQFMTENLISAVTLTYFLL